MDVRDHTWLVRRLLGNCDRVFNIILRGGVRWQSAWIVLDAPGWWLLWTTSQQNISRSVLSCYLGGSLVLMCVTETVSEPEILAILKPMIKRYALERLEGERFGDFTIRAGYISPTTAGKEWYVGMGGEGEYKQ